MISLIHPSRSRPDQSAKTIHKWINSASNIHNLELIVSCDINDPLLGEYESLYSLTIFKNNPVVANENSSAIDAINYAAKISTGEILIVVSDDTDCIPGWDMEILKEVSGKYDWILKTQDGIQPWIITMPVMDRAYYNRFEYIYYPEYKHLFCDTELTCVADITERKIVSGLTFPHKHYSVTGEKPDEIHRKNDATWQQGEELFLRRYEMNFGLPPGGQIRDRGMINYLKRNRR